MSEYREDTSAVKIPLNFYKTLHGFNGCNN